MNRSSWKFWKTGPVDDSVGTPDRVPFAALSGADAIITPNEPNLRHGIGIIVERFFGHFPNVLSIRSENSFGGKQDFGAYQVQIPHAGLARWESYQFLLQTLNGGTIRRILCIPFFSDDLITAICLKELFGAPLCVYVMDDNNIGAHGIPDQLFREALAKADLRLGISPEIRDAYENKFHVPFYVLPPLVQHEHVLTTPILPEAAIVEKRPAALIGNIWSQQWLERLRSALRGSDVKLHWYGNTKASWLQYSEAELAADGITTVGFLPEDDLIEKLRWHPFAVIPSGSLDEHDDRPELARLSLPSRIPYLAAVANLPLIVLGHPKTAAGQFVERFQIGLICPYESNALRESARSICQLEAQWLFRKNAARIADAFTLEDPGQWLWSSLAKYAPSDNRFERLMPKASA
ncbi:MAG TPA: hypothetical protein VGR78_11670 [Verrucomicrobiae bacterium]|nr:hypothetical protein [Verrucomicrobiae bacterium]